MASRHTKTWEEGGGSEREKSNNITESPKTRKQSDGIRPATKEPETMSSLSLNRVALLKSTVDPFRYKLPRLKLHMDKRKKTIHQVRINEGQILNLRCFFNL